MGGLPRRATWFSRVRAENGPERLYIAGPYEFLPFNEYDDTPSLVFAKSFIDAYKMLDYDRVYITPEERDWLTKYGGPDLPASFRVMGDTPLTDIVERNGKRIGFVLFPVPAKFFEATGEDVVKVEAVAEGLRGQVDLVVGISGWGRTNEQFYLEHASPALDVLIGTGPGSGMRGVIEGQGSTYWVRSLTKGKYLLLLDIKSWPDENRRWKKPETIDEKFEELDVRIPDDTAVRALFQGK